MRASAAVIAVTVMVWASACARAPLQERIAHKDVAYLCHHFAQYVFEGQSDEAVAFLRVIRAKGFDQDPACRLVYEARMTALTSREARRTPWEVAVPTP